MIANGKMKVKTTVSGSPTADVTTAAGIVSDGCNGVVYGLINGFLRSYSDFGTAVSEALTMNPFT